MIKIKKPAIAAKLRLFSGNENANLLYSVPCWIRGCWLRNPILPPSFSGCLLGFQEQEEEVWQQQWHLWEEAEALWLKDPGIILVIIKKSILPQFF